MLHKEFKRIDKATRLLSKSLEQLYKELNEILSNQVKNYSLSFKDKKFEIFYPSTKEEADALSVARRKYIEAILGYVINKRITMLSKEKSFQHKEIYDILYALAEGEDPRDHSISASVVDDFKDQISAEDELYGNGRPLDKESYHVKNDMYEEKEEFDDGAVV